MAQLASAWGTIISYKILYKKMIMYFRTTANIIISLRGSISFEEKKQISSGLLSSLPHESRNLDTAIKRLHRHYKLNLMITGECLLSNSKNITRYFSRNVQ